MNAPLIWIGIPAIVAFILLGLTRWKRLTASIAIFLELGLTGLAWILPVGKLTQFGIFAFEINPAWSILGRKFVLQSSDRPIIVILNLALILWFIGALECDIHPRFIPLGIGLSALMSAALFIQPFYYGVIFLFIAMVLAVVMLANISGQVGVGMIRFLIFQALSLPFLLLAGWMVSNLEINPNDTFQLTSVSLMISLGLSLILAVFPFHSWLDMVSTESHPFLVSYLFFIIPFMTNIFSILFIQQNPLFNNSLWVVAFFRINGFLMTMIGGLEAAFHHHLGKLMSYAIMVEIGMIQLILGLGFVSAENRSFMAIIFPLIFASLISLVMLGLSMSILQSHFKDLSLSSITGSEKNFPLATIAVFISLLCLAGFPITAEFPAYLAIWQSLFLNFPLGGISALVGSLGILIGCVRTLAVMMRTEETMDQMAVETSYQKILLGVGILVIFIMGIFPQIFVPITFNMGITFLGGG